MIRHASILTAVSSDGKVDRIDGCRCSLGTEPAKHRDGYAAATARVVKADAAPVECRCTANAAGPCGG
ncbi:hypothetical protein [Streptomyces millisiae]|uniref:Uncharacterized protein n=1 Tax=Streptomyces millisiae TaxID=3075542 RepID=A0ABU2LQM2_9ACTN|nr:hypothetical protein [Streptomyces sp. DSM 44918]MDT0319876.1 hypothetical protein [Streptomyces sp. DSM 44918]